MWYYLLIIFSVMMFGARFALQDIYRKLRGSGLRISLETSLVGALAGLCVLFAVNGFRIEFTPFTLLVASFAALNSIAFAFCSFKALDTIDLSLFSLFSMLGGMLLPFFQGIVFFDENITVAKIVCLVLIAAALALTVSPKEKKKGTVYYVGIFILNGMSGVLSKIFASAPFEKTSSASYSIWIAICTTVLSGALLLLLVKKADGGVRYNLKAFSIGAVSGGINQFANFLLIVALMHVDASVQYPMVTGGVMIVSTLISLFGNRKPDKKELLSVALAFFGMLALFFIPI